MKRMNVKTIKQTVFRLAAAVAALVLAGCAASTPMSRVAQSPQLYEPLPSAQKESVMQGRVVEGMSPDAVYLAWGKPDRVTRGSENGVPFELWSYTQLQPVYHTGVAMGYGYGYGYRRYGRYGRYYDPGYLAVETGPDYIPVTAAVVRFSRNRVVRWERLR